MLKLGGRLEGRLVGRVDFTSVSTNNDLDASTNGTAVA